LLELAVLAMRRRRAVCDRKALLARAAALDAQTREIDGQTARLQAFIERPGTGPAAASAEGAPGAAAAPAPASGGTAGRRERQIRY
jgi:hypothetical protein